MRILFAPSESVSQCLLSDVDFAARKSDVSRPLLSFFYTVMQELEPVFDKVAQYFSLLSDASRLKVIHAICNQEKSVNDVVAETGLSQSTVSRHLANLHHAGVASRKKDGTLALYAITDRTLTDICRTACVSLVAREEENAAQLAPIRKQAARFMPDPAAMPAKKRAANATREVRRA
jgi:DNA-binding transcriptional ArsR family regulator